MRVVPEFLNKTLSTRTICYISIFVIENNGTEKEILPIITISQRLEMSSKEYLSSEMPFLN